MASGFGIQRVVVVDTLLAKNPFELALRRARVGVSQTRRLLAWTVAAERWQRPAMTVGRGEHPVCIYRREIAIARTDEGADPVLERGKWVNLALAAPHFNGLELTPHVPLSFWRVLGRCTRARGYRHGTEVRGGCIVPTLGGGICLLSNALFRMACELGFAIVERHGHTMEAAPPEDDAPWGLDATVFWPHVDLRFAPREGPVRLDVEVRDQTLSLAAYAVRPSRLAIEVASVGDVTYQHDGVRWRANRVLRRIRDRADGTLVARDVVADNRRQLLHSHEMRRNCLSCDETGCHARPRDLATISLASGR